MRTVARDGLTFYSKQALEFPDDGEAAENVEYFSGVLELLDRLESLEHSAQIAAALNDGGYVIVSSANLRIELFYAFAGDPTKQAAAAPYAEERSRAAYERLTNLPAPERGVTASPRPTPRPPTRPVGYES